MKIIINADDFGFSKSVNQGIIDCYNSGLITSTSMMMNTPFTDEAIKLTKENNMQNVGIHLNLTYGKSVLEKSEVKSLVDSNGVFHYVCMLGYYTQYVDAKKELKAQIEKFYESGLKPTHLDYHHYFHEVPVLLQAYLELAKEYNLPVRTMTRESREKAKAMGLKTTDEFSFDFHGSGVSLDTLKHIHDKYKDKNITLVLLTHIGYIDEYTMSQTSYLSREFEIDQLKEAEAINLWKDVEKISFKDL